MTVNGIDIANYQSSDYPTSGLDFVFVKATEGRSYTNPKHTAQVATARKAGLLVGHYHFMRPGSPTVQASYFLDHARPRPGDLLACDWEDEDVSIADKNAFMRAVKTARPDLREVLYANLAFWHRDTTSYCADGLWIADPSAPKGKPRVEHPWLFHQYSEAGGLDHNVGNFADRAALHHWATTTRTPAQEDDMAMTDEQMYDALMRTDRVPAPAHAPDREKNPTWTLESCVRDLQVRVRAIQAAQAAPEIDYAKLAAALIAAATKGAS